MKKKIIKFPSGHYCASISVLWGDRKLSDFIVAADLGITGVGARDVITLTYKEGIVPDEARVTKAMDDMILESDAQRTPAKIHNYKILSIDFIPATP